MYTTTNGRDVPKNFEEFCSMEADVNGEGKWIKWTRSIVYKLVFKYKLKDALNNPDDLLMEVLMLLCKVSYVENYNSEKGRPFEVYLFVFVNNLLMKKVTKENTKNGRLIVNRASLEPCLPSETSDISSDCVYLDTLEFSVGSDSVEDIIYKDFIDKIKKDLVSFKSSSSSVYNGVTYERNPLTVFELILQDRTVAQISDIFGTSKQFVYNLMKKIRSCPSVQEMRNWYFSKE